MLIVLLVVIRNLYQLVPTRIFFFIKLKGCQNWIQRQHLVTVATRRGINSFIDSVAAAKEQAASIFKTFGDDVQQLVKTRKAFF